MDKAIKSPIQAEDIDIEKGTLSVDKKYPYSRRNPTTNKPSQSLDNYITFIRNHPDLKSALRFNLFSTQIEFNGEAMIDEYISEIRTTFERESSLTPVKKEYVVDATLFCAKKYGGYDPVMDRLMAIKDCFDPETSMPQLNTWLAKVLKQEQSEYLSIVGEIMVRLIIRRQLRPGAHSPYCFSLVGGQGVGKTFFPGTLIQPLSQPGSIRGEEMVKIVEQDLSSADSLFQMNKHLIVLFDEGSAVSKAEIGRVKTFITKDTDGFRKAYGRFDIEQKRRFTTFLTENRMQFLNDDENRRFLPIEFKELYNFDLLSKINKQLLAEAYYEETRKDGKPLPEMPKAMLKTAQENFIDGDVWDEPILELINSKATFKREPKKFTIGNNEIWAYLTRQEATGAIDVRSFGQREKIRINKIMKRLGFESVVVRDGAAQIRKFVLSEKALSEVNPEEDDELF